MATAFVTSDAFDEAVDRALLRNADVRFLTGTFGNGTRRATFEHILRSAQRERRLRARIWQWRTGQLHAKLMIWKLHRGPAVAWIGSANLTRGGLQNEGEIVFEIRSGWGARAISSLRAAFDAEWRRGIPLTREFVSNYKEARRAPPDARIQRHVHSPRAKRLPPRTGFFTAVAERNLAEHSPVVERVWSLLGGIDDSWLRHHVRGLQRVKEGDWCLFLDCPSHMVSVVRVTRARRDGRALVFAYRESGRPVGWNDRTRVALRKAGVLMTKRKRLRTRWIERDSATAIERVMRDLRRRARS